MSLASDIPALGRMATRAHVLLAQTDSDVACFVAHNIGLEGFDVSMAHSLRELQSEAARRRFDALVLDDEVITPAEFERIAQGPAARTLGATPVIWLLSASETAVANSQAVIRKPVQLSELCGAVRRATWARRQHTHPDALVVGDIVIEPWAFRVRCNGRAVDLTLTEFKLLSVLASEPGRVFSRTELLKEIWGPGATIEPQTINQHIVRLRRGLRAASVAIRTVRNAGYALQ